MPVERVSKWRWVQIYRHLVHPSIIISLDSIDKLSDAYVEDFDVRQGVRVVGSGWIAIGLSHG
jgi:hypothetical protein